MSLNIQVNIIKGEKIRERGRKKENQKKGKKRKEGGRKNYMRKCAVFIYVDQS